MMGALYAMAVLVLLIVVLATVGLPMIAGWPEEPYRTDVLQALWFGFDEPETEDQ